MIVPCAQTRERWSPYGCLENRAIEQQKARRIWSGLEAAYIVRCLCLLGRGRSAQRTAAKLRPHQETKSCKVATSQTVVHDHAREAVQVATTRGRPLQRLERGVRGHPATGPDLPAKASLRPAACRKRYLPRRIHRGDGGERRTDVAGSIAGARPMGPSLRTPTADLSFTPGVILDFMNT